MHKSKAVSGIITCFLILSSLLVFFNVDQCKAAGKTIWVDDDYPYPKEADGSLSKPYPSIQSAVDAASDGDTIKVLPGIYGGDLVIDKFLTLVSDDPVNTIIVSSARTSYLVDITADSVSLEGFTIQDNTDTSHRKAVIHVAPDTSDVVLTGNIIDYSYNAHGIWLHSTYKAVIKDNVINDTRGIKVEYSNENSIYRNNISNSSDEALRLLSSNSNHIEDNIIRRNNYGIYVRDSADNVIKSNTVIYNSLIGIAVYGGSGNTISYNTVKYNDNTGIDLGSSQSYIIGNNVRNNGIGIGLGGSSCTVRKNTIRYSTSYGLYAKLTSVNNEIYNNTFKNKGTYHAKEDGSNQWDDGVSLGNYWDDFYGPDPSSSNTTVSAGSNLFHYRIGGVNDRYPKGVFQKPPTISSPSPSHLATGVSLKPTLSVNVVDPDPDPYKERLDVYFYYILEGEYHLVDIDSQVESGTRASVPFFSTIKGKNAVYSYLGTGYDYIGVWYIVVKDGYSQSKSPEWIFTTRHVPIDNKKPTADPGGPYSGKIDKAINFDGSGCKDNDGTIEFYRWSFGDGTSAFNVKSPTHTYRNAGEFNVSLVVIDNDGSSSTSSTYANIKEGNDPPVAAATCPSAATVGQSIQLSGAGSTDPDSDSISYRWDFDNDGTFDTDWLTTATTAHIYTAEGNYTVKLKVKDSEGATHNDYTYILISSPQNGLPGFEIILVVIAILSIFIWRRRKKI